MQLILSARCSRSLYSSQTTTPHPQQQHPTHQPQKDQPGHHASRHRTNTETPSTQPPTPRKGTRRPGGLLPQNPTVHQTYSFASHDPCALPTPPTPTRGPALRTKPHTPHNTNHANTRTPENNHTIALENPFPSVEFIDIPPSSNPPAPHSGTDMGNQNWLAP